jgi:hypothetical protein
LRRASATVFIVQRDNFQQSFKIAWLPCKNLRNGMFAHAFWQMGGKIFTIGGSRSMRGESQREALPLEGKGATTASSWPNVPYVPFKDVVFFLSQKLSSSRNITVTAQLLFLLPWNGRHPSPFSTCVASRESASDFAAHNFIASRE